MNMTDATALSYLDGYCERAGDPGIWGEPLNAATNLCFLVAALAAAYAIGKLNRPGRAVIDLWLLVAALAAIAIGSGLWHIAPRHDTVLMDVIPITIFINIYLIAALRRFFRLAWWKIAALWAAYTAIGVAAQILLPPDTLNGTIMYVPTYLTLLVLTGAIRRVDAESGRAFIPIVLIWTASLVFRTIDMQICAIFPYGTHFLWHTLNAIVLYRLLIVLAAKAK